MLERQLRRCRMEEQPLTAGWRSRRGRPVERDKDRMAKQMANGGMSAAQIARIMGVSKQRVCQRLRRIEAEQAAAAQ